MTKPTAIPTTYRDVDFRSRLEARWAALFDELGWSWEYEPVDLAGYIPDFILRFNQPLLVEVKPAVSLAELAQHSAKIERSGWEDEVLLVGSWFFQSESWEDRVALGLLRETWGDKTLTWDIGVAGVCRSCREFSVMADVQSYRCRVCGRNDSGLLAADGLFEKAWRGAGSAVQWHPSQDRRELRRQDRGPGNWPRDQGF